METKTERAIESTSEQKKPYRRPRLIEYGSVTDITRGASGLGTDGGTSNQTYGF